MARRLLGLMGINYHGGDREFIQCTNAADSFEIGKSALRR
jgi:hypothetical protein